jgi:hypothetical protein
LTLDVLTALNNNNNFLQYVDVLIWVPLLVMCQVFILVPLLVRAPEVLLCPTKDSPGDFKYEEGSRQYHTGAGRKPAWALALLCYV